MIFTPVGHRLDARDWTEVTDFIDSYWSRATKGPSFYIWEAVMLLKKPVIHSFSKTYLLSSQLRG